MDWDSVFGIHVSVIEIALRGSCVYWFLFLTFRFVLRRDVGALGVADILLLVIVADAAQNAMAGEYKTVSEGLLLIGTIVLWNVLIDRLAFRFRWFERFARPRSIELIRDGRLLRRNLEREHMTVSELEAKLRQHGKDKIDDIRLAYLEGDGKVSVLEAEPSNDDAADETGDDDRPQGA
jgi:uncharacterized membrane protein YcaP (DUF421 family)